MTQVNGNFSTYHFVFVKNKNGTYSALIAEFPGCITEGRTMKEANKNLKDVAARWVEAALGMGQTIPEPWEAGEIWRMKP